MNEMMPDEMDEQWDEATKEELAEEVEEPSDDDGYIEFEIPDVADEEARGCWYSHLPSDDQGDLDWHDLVPIEGKLPTTSLTRKAHQLVPKRMKKDPYLALKEAQENLLRLCITKIGDHVVTAKELRGAGLDEYLTYKQQMMVGEFFTRLTAATEDEVDAFLAMTKSGRRLKR